MALIRNIAGIPKLGTANPDMDMQRMMDVNYGGGSYYDPVYPEVPLVEPEKEYEGPLPVDYGGGSGLPMPGPFYGPDNTGEVPGPSDQQPVYPILPIREYETTPVEQPVVPNTAPIPQGSGSVLQNADLGALGVLGAIMYLSLFGQPKSAIGYIAYGGALTMLYLRLRNVHIVPAQPVNE